MPAVGHPPNISMLPILVNRYAICTVPALLLMIKNGFSSFELFYGTIIRLIHFTLNKNKSQYFLSAVCQRGAVMVKFQ